MTTWHGPPAAADTTARQHQGRIEIVARRGAKLTEARVLCRYGDGAYRLPVCGALARYVAFLRLPHPDDTAPSSGDFTRLSGDPGGWRGNLVITPQRLDGAPAGLRGAVVHGLAATHGTPIKVVPPGVDCVVNPNPCFRNVPTTIHKVIDAINRHGFDLRRIQPEQIPERFTSLLPAGAHIAGAATNAGDPAVARRGYMLTIQFDRTIPSSARGAYVHLLGRTWGVFVDEDFLTFYHPFVFPRPLPHDLYKKGPRNRLRRIREYQAQARIDAKKDKYGYLVIRTMDALTRTR